MEHIIEKKWTTGSNEKITFSDLLKILKEYTQKGSKIFIGSDSFSSNSKTCFATAVCLYGGEKRGRYFFYKDHAPKIRYTNLVSRITEETRRSVEVACFLMEKYKFDPSNIELHLDVSPFQKGAATSKYSEMLKGYVQGFGVDFRIKPNAWASQTIADRHSK